MGVLTKDQIEKLAEIIRQHATWITWRIFGTRYVSESDLNALKVKGILPMDVQVPAIKYAFVLGKLEALLQEAEWKGLSWSELVDAAAATHTEVENFQIQAAELSAYTVLRGLETDIQDGLYESLATATQRTIDEAYVKKIIKDETQVGVEMSRNLRAVARDMAEKTGEFERNWLRVASNEMHAARQNGIVAAILNKIDVYQFAEEDDSWVSVVPDPEACKDCRRVYLDTKGNPKIFKLRELLENSGSNYIRPWRQNAKPVVPPLHPHCFCRLQYIPRGWGWVEGKMELLEPEKVVERARARMKSSVQKGIEILKSNPHQLLHEAHKVSMPTEDEIKAANSSKVIRELLRRIHALKQMHSDDFDLYYHLDDMEIAVLQRDYELRNQKDQEVSA